LVIVVGGIRVLPRDLDLEPVVAVLKVGRIQRKYPREGAGAEYGSAMALFTIDEE